MIEVTRDSSKIYRHLKEVADGIRIIDTHEHLQQERERTSVRADLFQIFLSHYASSDLVSSGMLLEDLNKVRDPNLPLEERWKILEPFWTRIQNTGYARAINIAAKDLYGIDGINKTTYKTLASRVEEANKLGLYDTVLKKKSGIDLSIWDGLSYPYDAGYIDKRFFVPVSRFEEFITARERTNFESLGKQCGRPIHSFSDLVESLEILFAKISNILVGVKIGLAYVRNLRFDKVSQAEAERIFVNILKSKALRDSSAGVVPEGVPMKDAKPLQNFMVHKIIQLATSKNLPIQIHTGFQEGNDNIITNSKPTQLINLFREYPEARFDIFHGSYPYIGELTTLAKNFRNVYIDMCWLHVISPSKAREALSDWLDAVPSNKIFGFGGDYLFVEGVYGHSVIARENIARVLTEKVEDGAYTMKQAVQLAKRLLRENAHDFFLSRTSA